MVNNVLSEYLRHVRQEEASRVIIRHLIRALRECLDNAANLNKWQASYHICGIRQAGIKWGDKPPPAIMINSAKYRGILDVLDEAETYLDMPP